MIKRNFSHAANHVGTFFLTALIIALGALGTKSNIVALLGGDILYLYGFPFRFAWVETIPWHGDTIRNLIAIANVILWSGLVGLLIVFYSKGKILIFIRYIIELLLLISILINIFYGWNSRTLGLLVYSFLLLILSDVIGLIMFIINIFKQHRCEK